MNAGEFELLLSAAQTHVALVEVVAAYFGAHELFYGHGTDCAEGEAGWLLGAVLDWDEGRWAAQPQADDVTRIAAIAQQRVNERVPLGYLLGEGWFAGLRFEISRQVLVPRSPFAEVIEHAFEPWIGLAEGDRLLDIGTGSGCIAIAAAVHLPGVLVDATDVSVDALGLATRNVQTHHVADRVELFEADMYPQNDRRYRVIMTNPPYVPSRRIRELPPEYHHEPVLGLDGGEDGLRFVRQILANARARLVPDGALFVEVGEADTELESAFPRLPLTWLEFDHGGSGVFVINAEQLAEAGF